MVTSAPLVVTENLGRTFGSGQGQVTALHDATIEIWGGEFTVILGPSGSGKSTLLNMIGGMDRPTTGTIRFHDQQLDQFSERDLTGYRRDHVGFVFQFYNLIPNLTALENVALAGALVLPKAEAAERSQSLLNEVGLGHRLNQFPHQLSGGEMQRVTIARALVKQPSLLLCDEPSGALDSVTGTRVLAHLQNTARTSNTAVVVVTHDQEIAKAADRLIRLRDGEIQEYSRQENPVQIGAAVSV